MAALDVLTLVAAKRYLNEPADVTQFDDELREDFIPPAVARVQRHLGRELVDAATATPEELLACKVVLAEYWRSQSGRFGRGSFPSSPAIVDADSGPAGYASLTDKLTELLGPPVESAGAQPTGGGFPTPASWPDPADRRCW